MKKLDAYSGVGRTANTPISKAAFERALAKLTVAEQSAIATLFNRAKNIHNPLKSHS